MKIKELYIKNYRCFEEITVPFDNSYNLHVIIAPNMVGKSALLKALRVAASSYLRKIAPTNNKSISSEEHRVIGSNPFTDVARECIIECSADLWVYTGKEWATQTFQWRIFRENSTKVKTKYENLGQLDFDRSIKRTFDRVIEKKEECLPVFLYVGTEYIHQPHARTDSLKLDGTAIQGYWYCFEEKSMESYVFEWLKRMYNVQLEQHEKSNAQILYGTLPKLFLEGFEGIIKALFPDEITHVQWIKNFTESKTRPRKEGEKSELRTISDYILTFGFKNGEVRTYEMLSDGYRYLILLAGELITRCVLLNKHLEGDVAPKTNGLVLIDEFGIHLHPELQMSAIQRLCNAFPQVQFIISTHSPMLLNGLKKEQVHILEIDNQGHRMVRTATTDIVGLGAEGILKDLFGMLTTFDDTSQAWASDYKELFVKKEQTGLTHEESDKFEDLEKKLSSITLDPTLVVDKAEDPLYEQFKERLKKFEEAAAAQPSTLSNEQMDEIIREVIKNE